MGKIPSLTDCNPGFQPTEYNVVIRPEEFETVTSGGIILTDTTTERDGLAAVRGRLVAVSPLAFTYHDAPGAKPRSGWVRGTSPPQVGDAVIFKKYGGILVDGDDGAEYRLLKDSDVIAVLTPPVAEPAEA